MKVLGVYDKNDDLKCHGKNIFDTTDKYLRDNFPSEYRINYDMNLGTLKLFKLDEFTDDSSVARYVDKTNTILYTQSYALGHELFHVAGYDKTNKVSSLDNRLGIEEGLEEGMTEYLHMKAYNLPYATAYFFESFCVEMLEEVPELFKAYFMPNESDFCKLFPNSKDAYSLMYALDTYHAKHYSYVDNLIDNKKDLQLKVLMERAVKETLDDLITIELSLGKSDKELNLYGDKFLDLIKEDNLKRTLNAVYPKYYEYAETEVKKRIR